MDDATPYQNREIREMFNEVKDELPRNDKGRFIKGFPYNKGAIRTEEAKKKNSDAHKGKKASEKTRQKMRNRKVSEETRKKLSIKSKGRKHSEETKRKISETRIRLAIGVGRKGELSPLWKGGLTPVNQVIRTSREYKLWRIAVFQRDNYTCIWCGVRCGNGKKVILHADHIKPFAYFPELRFAIDNGRTLCIDCHKTTDTYANKAKQIYG